MRLLLIAFLLEIGFVLVVLPWSTFWDHNYFAFALPTLRAIVTNNFVRGAVSGLGLVNMLAAVLDLLSPMFARPRVERSSLGITPSAAEE